MVCEARITGVEFDQFWYESVKDHVAYFFRWLGAPRSSVLVVFSDESLYHLECRTLGDQLVPRMKAEPIITEVVKRFQGAGFWRDRPVIDENVYPGKCKARYSFDAHYLYLRRLGDQDAAMSDRYHRDVMPQNEDGVPGIVVDAECYEDPDYSEAEDRYSDPIAALVETRKIAREAGLTDEEIARLFPLPK